jgi:STE24 endopeptidase
VALLAGVLLSGASVAIRNLTEPATAPIGPPALSAAASVLLYVCCLALLKEAGEIPISFYTEFLLEHRYDLSNQRFGAWLFDRLKLFVLGLALAGGGALIVYALIGLLPQLWWLTTGLVFALAIVGVTNVAPLVLLPLFYRLRPLEREPLQRRLLALADRAGARAIGAYEWRLGDKTKKANAALAGLGVTRRILVSDTMLSQYSDEEIEVVLAHELAHHVHGDLWKAVALESMVVIAGFYVAASVLDLLVVPLDLRGRADVAGLPLLVLAVGSVSLATVPVAHALSRAHERRADRFALRLTENPGAFVSAMRRLAAQNLAEEHPSTLVRLLFHSHPPVAERIAAAGPAEAGGSRRRSVS